MIAPSARLLFISSTRAGSISRFSPRPSHSGQAPNGLLKENMRGLNSGRLKPHSGQEKSWLNIFSSSPFSPSNWITTIPSLSSKASSRDSARRLLILSFITSRSTTALISCFLFFSNWISSSEVYSYPSTINRPKPSRKRLLIVFLCSPFCPLTTGARTLILLPSGKVRRLSTT